VPPIGSRNPSQLLTRPKQTMGKRRFVMIFSSLIASAMICITDSFLLCPLKGTTRPSMRDVSVKEYSVCSQKIDSKELLNQDHVQKFQHALMNTLKTRRSLLSSATTFVFAAAHFKSPVFAQTEGNPAAYPTDDEIKRVQKAILSFDRKELNQAQGLFTQSIDRWEQLKRPK
jgi:hypothetical protein